MLALLVRLAVCEDPFLPICTKLDPQSHNNEKSSTNNNLEYQNNDSESQNHDGVTWNNEKHSLNLLFPQTCHSNRSNRQSLRPKWALSLKTCAHKSLTFCLIESILHCNKLSLRILGGFLWVKIIVAEIYFWSEWIINRRFQLELRNVLVFPQLSLMKPQFIRSCRTRPEQQLPNDFRISTPSQQKQHEKHNSLTQFCVWLWNNPRGMCSDFDHDHSRIWGK